MYHKYGQNNDKIRSLRIKIFQKKMCTWNQSMLLTVFKNVFTFIINIIGAKYGRIQHQRIKVVRLTPGNMNEYL